MTLDGRVRTWEFVKWAGFNSIQAIYKFIFLDGDPEEACEQELSGLYGAIQGEQLSEHEERLWHHPLFSRNEFFLCGQDDHPQSQTEHGQRLDVALKRKVKKERKLKTLQIRAVQHLPLSLTAVSKVICETQALPFPHPRLCALYKRRSICLIYNVSIFVCVWTFGWSEMLGGGWTGEYIKDNAPLGSALRQRRRPLHRPLC